MERKTIPTGEQPHIVIDAVHGSLRLIGWDNQEVSVESSLGGQVHLTAQERAIHLSSMAKCKAHIPLDAEVLVKQIFGSLWLSFLERANITIEQVVGNLTLQNTGRANIHSVGGNLVASQLHGNTIIDDLQGSLSLQDVHGPVSISIQAVGAAHLRLHPEPGQNVFISSSGEIICELPERAAAQIEIRSDTRQIHLGLHDYQKSISAPEYALTLGEGGAMIKLISQGNVTLQSSPGPEGKMAGEDLKSLEQQIEDQISSLSAAFEASGLPADVSERITRQTREKARQAAQKAKRKIELKLAAAQRKTEQKTKKSVFRPQDRRYRQRAQPPSEQNRPTEETVTDEERMLILKMLQAKKITAQEAERLLDAIGGPN